jgi:AraC family transcriptional regulator
VAEDLSRCFPLEWSGLRAEHFRMTLNHELHFPPMAQHLLILYQRPPDEMSLKNEELALNAPPPPGSVAIIPAGRSSTRGFWRGSSDATHIQLDPHLIARVAVEAFDLDPDRVELPNVYGLSHPQLRAAISAIDVELANGGPGGRLLAESLANVVAVHLIRHATGNEGAVGQSRGGLPRQKLRAAAEYIEEHLDSEVSLDELAAVAHLSTYHFARLFKASTGLPPHQYVIARRIERAKQLLRGDDLSLAQVAARVGFWDQGHFTRHFKRLVGVTPGCFR